MNLHKHNALLVALHKHNVIIALHKHNVISALHKHNVIIALHISMVDSVFIIILTCRTSGYHDKRDATQHEKQKTRDL